MIHLEYILLRSEERRGKKPKKRKEGNFPPFCLLASFLSPPLKIYWGKVGFKWKSSNIDREWKKEKKTGKLDRDEKRRAERRRRGRRKKDTNSKPTWVKRASYSIGAGIASSDEGRKSLYMQVSKPLFSRPFLLQRISALSKHEYVCCLHPFLVRRGAVCHQVVFFSSGLAYSSNAPLKGIESMCV